MKFEHSVSIDGSRDSVWEILNDIPRAASCLPGVNDVRHEKDNTYLGAVRVQVGPMAFSLGGSVDITQDTDAGHWNMRARAQDKRIGGGVQANIDAFLTESSSEATELRVTADVQFLGRLGTLGQPLIKRKADELIQAFAENLQQAVREQG